MVYFLKVHNGKQTYTNPVHIPVGLWTGLPTTLFSLGDFLDGTDDCCFLGAALDGVTGALDEETLEVFDFISLSLHKKNKLCGVTERFAPHLFDDRLPNHARSQWVIGFQR